MPTVYVDQMKSKGSLDVVAPVVPTLLNVGARLVVLSHSKFSRSSTSGMKNTPLTFIDKLAGRIRYSVAGDQGIGGNTQDQIAARVAFTTSQKPDIIVLQTDHNSLNDGAATVIAKNDALDAAIATASPNSIRLWVAETPSNLYPPGNATITAVNADLAAKASGNRKFVDTATGFVFGSMTYDNVHPNYAGADYESGLIASAIGSLVTGQTVGQAIADNAAKTWRTANLDPCNTLATGGATPGTVAVAGSGVLPTGAPSGVADGHTITNRIAGVNAPVCSMGTVLGVPAQKVVVTGTASAEEYISIGRQNAANYRVPVNSAIGDTYVTTCGYMITASDGVSAPVGVLSWGIRDQQFSLGNTTSTDASQGTPTGSIIGPRFAQSYPIQLQTVQTNLRPNFDVRVAAGPVDFCIWYFGPGAFKTEKEAYALPANMDADGIVGAAQRFGRTDQGTTLVNGVAVSFQPGTKSGGNITYDSLKIYSGGTSTPGTGTLQQTVAGGTWTFTPTGITVGTGYVDLSMTNSFGTTIVRAGPFTVS